MVHQKESNVEQKYRQLSILNLNMLLEDRNTPNKKTTPPFSTTGYQLVVSNRSHVLPNANSDRFYSKHIFCQNLSKFTTLLVKIWEDPALPEFDQEFDNPVHLLNTQESIVEFASLSEKRPAAPENTEPDVFSIIIAPYN